MTFSGIFTLIFEIGYAFLIWRPRLRWYFLASAILLHGGIGLFLGLKTFSFIMLSMNMAFLRKEEVYWLFSLWPGSAESPVVTPTSIPALKPVASATGIQKA
jgi:hypothetical protein